MKGFTGKGFTRKFSILASLQAIIGLCLLVGSLALQDGLDGYLLFNLNITGNTLTFLNAPATPAATRPSVAIPFRSADRAVLMNMEVAPGHSAKFVLDTGATYTAITPALAKKLGIDLANAPTVRIATANGVVNVPRVKLSHLRIGGVDVKNVDATVMPLGTEDTELGGLLGLSFIRAVRLTIDPAGQRVVLEQL